MTLAGLLLFVVDVSIVLEMFALGIRAEPQDAIYLLRQPPRLLRSLLATNIIMPVCAVVLASAFHLNPAIKVALVTLAVSPVPPTLPKMQIKAGGHASYAIGLLVFDAILAIVFVPAVVPSLGCIFHIAAHIRMWAVAMLVIREVLVPLGAGMLIRWFAPSVAQRIASPVALAGTLLLVIGMAPIVFSASSDIMSLIGNGTIVAITAFSILGLAVGHLLGGQTPTGAPCSRSRVRHAIPASL